MKTWLVSAAFPLVLFAGPAASEATTDAVACSAGSYLAVASWAYGEAVRLTVAPVTRPLGEPRVVARLDDLEGPLVLHCRAKSFIVSGPTASFRVREPLSRSPAVEPMAPDLAHTAGDGTTSMFFRCRDGEAHMGTSGLSLESQLPLGPGSRPADLSGRRDPFSLALRRSGDDAAEPRRWQLVVQQRQRRGTPSGRMAPAPVQREATVLELVCPRNE